MNGETTFSSEASLASAESTKMNHNIIYHKLLNGLFETF